MRYYLFLLFFLINFSINAQFVVEKQLELPVINTGLYYGVVPAGKDGIILFNEVQNLESLTKRKWEISHFDTLLNPKWSSYFESEYNFSITQVKYYEGYIYLMFEDTNIPMKSVLFARSSFTEDVFEFFEIKEFLPKEIVGFEILRNSLFLIGLDEERPAILKFRYGDSRPQVLRGLYNDNNDLLSSEISTNKDLIQIVTRMNKRRGGKDVLLVKQFDEWGDIHKDILIESARGYDLINCKATTDEEDNICVVGTFKSGNSKYSHGIFTMVADSDLDYQVYYYDYISLHNFFNYLPEKEKEKIDKKYKQGKGNKKSNYKVNQVPRQIAKTSKGWTYLGEIVKYTERNSNIYGNMWPMEYRQYSHAVALGIGDDGKLQWDNSFSMNSLSTSSSLQKMHLSELDSNSIMYYLSEDNILFKEINGGRDFGGVGNFSLVDIKHYKPDFSKRQSGNILHWYDNKIIVIGSYFTKGERGRDQRIFYLNKLKVSTK